MASKVSLADILREHWPGYARAHRASLAAPHYRAARAVMGCRTPAMGARAYRCEGCAETHFAYHSCNHRSCPQCGALDGQTWTAKQEARLLPVPYFMVTFTIPAELRVACLRHPKVLYDLLLRESAGALRDVIETKTKGGRAGFTSVLHTWGRQMQHHPHVHCIVPAAALAPDRQSVIRPAKDGFLIHYRPLAARFRSRMQSALREQYPDIYKELSREAQHALTAKTRWNVHLQHTGTGKTAVRYLARYVQRSAVSAKRIIGYDKAGNILVRFTDSNTKKTGVLKLRPHEFIRRWLIHVLPKGFTRVRHFGFLSSAATKTRALVRQLLGARPEAAPDLADPEPFACPCCGAALVFLRELPRGPPISLDHFIPARTPALT